LVTVKAGSTPDSWIYNLLFPNYNQYTQIYQKKGKSIMSFDQTFNELNLSSTQRIQTLAGRLSEEELQHPVGEHWTVAIALAHLAFWDRRVMYVLDMTEREGKLFIPEIDIFVNDLSLPLWAAIPPRAAAQIAIETSQTLDQRLENYPRHLLEEIYTYNKRWVVRALHRNEHLDEVDRAWTQS
jgi:hypothetical protein